MPSPDPSSYDAANPPPLGTAANPYSPPVLPNSGQPPPPARQGVWGWLAAAGILVLKFFGSLKAFALPLLKFGPVILKSGGSMFLMFGIYAFRWGWQWAAGFVILLLVHECGHLVAARWFGLKVSAPIFIPFMGAFIALKEAPRDAWMEACVGIGGPILGSLGALVCHSLGELTGSGLLISLAYTGYWLNLFNLTPLSPLDGGRIATALSPWFWVPGLAVMGFVAWQRPSFIIFVILVASIPRVISLFRRKSDEERRYFEVTPERRLIMGAAYFGLIAALVLMMYTATNQLEAMGVQPGRRSSTQVQ